MVMVHNGTHHTHSSVEEPYTTHIYVYMLGASLLMFLAGLCFVHDIHILVVDVGY